MDLLLVAIRGIIGRTIPGSLMRFTPLCRFILVSTLLVLPVFGDGTFSSRPAISGETRMQLIRILNAEYVFVRKPFPLGQKGLVMKEESGDISPNDMQLRQLLARYGSVAKPGERVQITNVEIKNKAILFE